MVFMIPEKKYLVSEMLDSPIYVFIAQKSHLFTGRKLPIHFKADFSNWNDFERAK